MNPSAAIFDLFRTQLLCYMQAPEYSPLTHTRLAADNYPLGLSPRRQLSSAAALSTLTAYAKMLLLLLLLVRPMLTLLLPTNKTALVSGNRESGRGGVLTLGDARRIPRYLGAEPS